MKLAKRLMGFDKQRTADGVLGNSARDSRVWAHGAGLLTLLLPLGLAACEGCRSTGGASGSPSAQASAANGVPQDAGPPTLRIFVVSDLAGALEPCGCTKDQLGGLDHLAAWTRSEQAKAPVSAIVSAGPLFFMDETLKPDHAAQDVAKAETIARALSPLGFAAFAPGTNDFAGGASELAKLRDASGAQAVAANMKAEGPLAAAPFAMRAMNGVKVAFVGVTAADAKGALPPVDVPLPRLRDAVDAARKEGAHVVIALAAVGRGEAKRLADGAPGLTAIVVGSPGGGGEANTTAPPPERIGDVLIVETGNHLQTVGMLDLFVRQAAGDRGPIVFADATGLDEGRQRAELARRIDELRAKIAAWEKDGKIAKGDLDARRAELAKLLQSRAALDAPKAPPKGSFFRYTVQEIRDGLGKDPGVADAMLVYYKQVNERNKVAFADRLPLPHTPDQPVFVGVDACTKCHKEAREVWDGTKHSHAYATLATQFKEFNLDCVSCHVTGYDQPGGSTVTHVERLTNVQCEVCHGPGSKHSANPKVAMPTRKPKADFCASSCHHPPHVADFDAEKRMLDILGPGHGM